MKLSIITINYNNAEGLRRTLESVAAQTYTNIEHVIVDGASTDNSVDVIKEYVQRFKIGDLQESFRTDKKLENVIWLSEKDNGVYHAMNKGIRKASGDYIQILNSGDMLAAPDVTERMMEAMRQFEIVDWQESFRTDKKLENGGIPILYGNMLKSYDGKKVVRDNCGSVNSTDSFMYFYRGTLNHDSAYIRRDLFDKYGLYNEEMKICSDWEWYVKAIALGGEKAVYTNIDVTIFDMNGVSESGGKNAELIKKERREYLEKILPVTVLRDYDAFSFPIGQYQRLKRHHLWGGVNFMERVLFKLEKWGVIK
ncbi:MAG: glycosyltransferase [Paludibacteraceae bacterium]|nr:glycosyltransferase [Paludibacteraceae bacterium]